jgi:hypothetical protein
VKILAALFVLTLGAYADDKLDPNDSSLGVLKAKAVLAMDEATYRKAVSIAVQGDETALQVMAQQGQITMNQNNMLPVHVEGGNGFPRVVAVRLPGYVRLWYTGADQVDRSKAAIKAAVEEWNKDD